MKFVGPQTGGKSEGMTIIAKASADLVAGAPYHFQMDETGYITKAITAAGGMVGVAKQAYLTGDYGVFVVVGTVKVILSAAAVTKGHALLPDVSEVAFKSTGGAFSKIIGKTDDTEMGAALEASAAGSELIDAYVDGRSLTCTA